MDRQAMNSGLAKLVASTILLAIWTLPAHAQVPVDEYGNAIGAEVAAEANRYAVAPPLTSAELSDLVGPVALYPDDLLAIVLPASTYPLEIVQAARFLEQYEQDSTLQPSEEWDESVTALLNYPEVLRMMDEDIDWTWQLGDAVVNQQADVIDAVESFRDRAYAAGNLKTDQYQTVNNDGGIIEIVPINEEIIYVPYYEPQRVLVSQVTPVYYYYPRPYPVYYYPYPVGYSFYNNYFWGVTTAYRIGWASHNLHVHHYSYWGHPYYGHSYYGHNYRRPSVNIYNNWYVNNSSRNVSNRYRDGDYWRPRQNGGARPGSADQRTRSYRTHDVARTDARDVRRTSSTASNLNSSRVAANRESTNANRTPTRSSGYVATTRSDQERTIRFRDRPETRDASRSDSQNRLRTESSNQPASRTPASTTSGNGATRNSATRPVTVRTNDTRDAVRPAREAPVRVNTASSNRATPAARVNSAASNRTDSTARNAVPRESPREPGRTVERTAPRQESRDSDNARSESAKQNRREQPAENRPAQSSARESTRASRSRN